MRIGTRGSDLATTQTSTVAVQLAKALGQELATVIIQTQGDRVTDRPLRELEGRGYFTKEIEEALLAGTIDLAVHSFKDMPSQAPEGLALAAVSVREDPADLLIVRPGAFDPEQGKIPMVRCAIAGTSAVRRESQACALRPDLITRDLRGNVPTRVAKLAREQYDAIFLASAGVRRLHLDLSAFKVVRLDPTWFVPSPGQGALAIQMRADDPHFAEVQAALNDPKTAIATSIERAVQAKFGGGCGLPLGVYAHHAQESWHVYGFWGADRVHPTWAAVSGDNPQLLADELFAMLNEGRTCAVEC
jgi:hydroxymethylbilane synthase